MSLNEDLRELASSKTRLEYIDSKLRTIREVDPTWAIVGVCEVTSLVVERSQLKRFINKMENEIGVKIVVDKHWLALSTENLDVLENKRLCRRELDVKPFRMSYDMLKQFRIMPWHWIAWRSLRMAQMDDREAMRSFGC